MLTLGYGDNHNIPENVLFNETNLETVSECFVCRAKVTGKKAELQNSSDYSKIIFACIL